MDEVMVSQGNVPAAILTGLRDVCLALPEATEEPAWVGTRWRIRRRTFAHVLAIESGWPPVYARAAKTVGPDIVLTFRSSGPELRVLRRVGRPFFATPWRADEVGMIFGTEVDWKEVAELLTDSYCLLAPKRLSESVDRPSN